MSNHVAVVTGGSRGIGRAVVDQLLAGGSQVTTCGRGARPKDLDPDVVWVQADVARPDDTDRLIQVATGNHGPLDLLVNNAGVQVERTVTDSSDDDWDLVVGTNCRGVFNTCRSALPTLTSRGGAIVNIGSISGVVSDPAMALYNASKGFVHALTRSIAVDHGPQVRCNAVSPGWIQTAMVDDAFTTAHNPRSARVDAINRHPAGRLGHPVDVARAVLWLASPEAAFITGQCLVVDGGLTAASPLSPELF